MDTNRENMDFTKSNPKTLYPVGIMKRLKFLADASGRQRNGTTKAISQGTMTVNDDTPFFRVRHWDTDSSPPPPKRIKIYGHKAHGQGETQLKDLSEPICLTHCK